MVAVVAGLFVAKHLWHAAWRSDANKHLEKAQDEARTRVGRGLDELFERQLDNDDNLLLLVATFEAKRTPYVTDADCAIGLTAAFAEALGKGVVAVASDDWKGETPHLGVTATFAPTDQVFQLPHSDQTFSGLSMSAEVTFLGKAFHVDVRPADELEFSYLRSFDPFDGRASESQVKGGIVQGTCRQLGYSILEKATTWRRPKPTRRDPVKECEDGFGCRDKADQVVAHDPIAAAKMYLAACEDSDEDACLRAAELAVSSGHDDRASAEFQLELACSRDLAKACVAAARVLLAPTAGKPPSDDEREEALPLILRGCDLGNPEACATAGPLVKQSKRFAEAAPLFTGGKSARSKIYGSIFALKWGQWTSLDSGQPTLWVTKEPAHPDQDTIVMRYDRSEAPKGLAIPDNVDVVYAIATKTMGDRCAACKPSGGGGGAYSFRALDCVCVIAH